MKIYECIPKNFPENIIPDFDETIPFVVGDTEYEVSKENTIKSRRYAWRMKTDEGYSWCGRHPRLWRELTEKERRSYNRFVSNTRKRMQKAADLLEKEEDYE